MVTATKVYTSLTSAFPELPYYGVLDPVFPEAACSDGTDNEIYLATLCAQCNDGPDNNGDAKIDHDGGLSALGYLAAEADPQCAASLGEIGRERADPAA